METPPPLTPPPLPTYYPSSPEDAVNLRLVGAAAGLTAFVDFLLWSPDVGGAAFAWAMAALAAAFALSAQCKSLRLLVLLAMAVASAVQAGLELKVSTVLVSTILLIGLVGEGHFPKIGRGIARWLELCAVTAFPFPALQRILVLFRTRVERAHGSRLGLVWRALQIVLPALLLAGLFASFFMQGNAIFQKMIGDLFTSFFNWLWSFDFSFGRLFFWVAVFGVLLHLLRPYPANIGPRVARHSLPRWERRDAALGLWQSVAVLAVLNALFFFVNTIDAVYLWSRSTLPTGVNPSAFLHEGVQGLIIAVLLSAAVLVVLFQQRLAQGSRVLQWLATAWVLQDLVVIAGVFLRLKLYVDDLQLTLLRIGVALFLALVVTGFGLLTYYFWRGKNFGWLVEKNAVATFALLFLVQFCDLNATVAQYNAGRWVRGGARFPDVAYLATLGPGAWPALLQLQQSTRAGLLTELSAQIEWSTREAQMVLADPAWRHREYLRTRRAHELLDGLKTAAPR